MNTHMATTFDNQRLYDISLESSLLLESVKLYEFNARLKAFRKLKRDLGNVLYKIEYDDLSFMTKKQLNVLIKNVKQISDGFYEVVSKEVLGMLEDFTEKAVAKEKRLWVTVAESVAQDEDMPEVTDKDADVHLEEEGRNGVFPLALLLAGGALWERIRKLPLSGLGQPIDDVMGKYHSLSNNRLEDLLERAWASGYSREELVTQILGEEGAKQGKKGAIGTMRAQLNAIIDTSLAFALTQVQSGVTSSMSSVGRKYRWVSVMDAVTTTICRGRNGKIYETGKGPLPPAHVSCRSSIAPLVRGEVDNDVEDSSLASWLESRSSEKRTYIKEYGTIMEKGGGDWSTYKATKPMTPNDFFNRTL